MATRRVLSSFLNSLCHQNLGGERKQVVNNIRPYKPSLDPTPVDPDIVEPIEPEIGEENVDHSDRGIIPDRGDTASVPDAGHPMILRTRHLNTQPPPVSPESPAAQPPAAENIGRPDASLQADQIPTIQPTEDTTKRQPKRARQTNSSSETDQRKNPRII